MLRPSAIFKWNGVEWTDLTAAVRTNSTIAFIAASTDVFYIGLDRRFVGLYVDLSTVGNYTSLTYEYFAGGTTWTALSQIDSYAFNTSKYIRWLLPNDWSKEEFTLAMPYTATSIPDSVERYWIRIKCSAVTTAAVISTIRCLPYVNYATSSDVYNFLSLKQNFSGSTKPTDLAVEDMIRRAEDRIDYKSKKSWRFNAVTESTDPTLVDYDRYGFFMRHRNFIKVYSVKLWNGSDWNTLTEGRNNDYFVNYDLGMIYITRLYLLPATYGLTGRYFHYGYGEFKNSVQVDYAYGKNSEIDPEFYVVNDIAIKLAASDVIKNHDYSTLIVSGTDKVSLESKVRLYAEEAEDRLESLCGVSIY